MRLNKSCVLVKNITNLVKVKLEKKKRNMEEKILSSNVIIRKKML